MPEYRVTWTIDLEAADAVAAARKARAVQVRADSTATVFDVEHRAPMISRQPNRSIDLDELDADDTAVALDELVAEGLIEPYDPDDDLTACARCHDPVATVSSDGLCDGCVAEDASAVQEPST